LVQVIAQVRFPELSSIDSHVERLREAFKAIGFPRSVPGVIQRMAVSSAGEPSVSATPRWDFFDLKRQWGLVLTRDFVLLQTSAYDRYPGFRQRLEGVLTALGPVVGTEAVARVGLRYIDTIEALEPGGAPADLLAPGLRGYSAPDLPSVTGAALSSRQETLLPTTVGTLAIRSLLRSDGGYLPPDLADTELVPPRTFTPGQPVVVLDFDHFVGEPEMLFESAALLGMFDALHAVMRDAFWTAVTPDALDAWATPR
jgi:uncharacterized protein (TIGR04255 family)